MSFGSNARAARHEHRCERRTFVFRITANSNDYLTLLYGGSEIENFEFLEDYEFIVTRAGQSIIHESQRNLGARSAIASAISDKRALPPRSYVTFLFSAITDSAALNIACDFSFSLR